MIVYEFYWRADTGKEHFIGMLPERRKKPERITNESVLRWGWLTIGDIPGIDYIYFVEVEM